MIHRSLLGLAVAGCLIACVTGTTSLGGPRGNQASASSSEDGGAADGGWSGSAYASMDAGTPGTWPCNYSWMPVPGTGACEYLLPTDRQNASPDLDSATWDPHNVRVDLWTAASSSKEIGSYREAVDACRAEHGWYYLPSSDGGRPTSYALCPTSCALVTNGGGQFRLSAFGWCGPI